MNALALADVTAFCDSRPKARDGLSDCHTCPIHGACASGCTPLTEQTLAAWQARCVDAFARFVGGAA